MKVWVCGASVRRRSGVVKYHRRRPLHPSLVLGTGFPPLERGGPTTLLALSPSASEFGVGKAVAIEPINETDNLGQLFP